MRILIITPDPDSFKTFTDTLLTHSAVAVSLAGPSSTTAAGTAAAARDAVANESPDLVVIDRHLPDADSLQLVADLMAVNAMIHTAVVTDLAEDEFHEASEGLGVLMALPPQPGADEAVALLEKARAVGLS